MPQQQALVQVGNCSCGIVLVVEKIALNFGHSERVARNSIHKLPCQHTVVATTTAAVAAAVTINVAGVGRRGRESECGESIMRWRCFVESLP